MQLHAFRGLPNSMDMKSRRYAASSLYRPGCMLETYCDNAQQVYLSLP
jgi:hypothetical protein